MVDHIEQKTWVVEVEVSVSVDDVSSEDHGVQSDDVGSLDIDLQAQEDDAEFSNQYNNI